MKDWDEAWRTPPSPERLVPSDFLVERVASWRPGRALDVAAGQGRNTLYLASLGWSVTAVDKSAPAMAWLGAEARERACDVTTRVADLERVPLPAGRFDLVVVCRYLQRDLFADLENRVGGALLYETFVSHPTMSPRFLLRPGELWAAFPTLRVEYCSEEGGLGRLLACRE